MNYKDFTKRGLLNAEFLITKVYKGKSNETMVIIADESTYSEAEMLCVCAKKLGLRPFIIDVSVYGISRFTQVDYRHIEPVKAAIDAADICVSTCLSFSKLLGSTKAKDGILTGEARCFPLWARGIGEWDFDFDKILAMRERTPKLKELVKKSEVLHVTTKKGTDLVCKVGEKNIAAIYEVLAITPFFAEVAIIPNYGTVNGVAIVDGAVSRAIRRNQFGERELDLEPIKLVIENGRIKEYSAAPLHRERLEKFMYKADPVADGIDEIGLVTATESINDDYQWNIWSDGTHHSNSMHIALGNNTRERDSIVHAPAHADFDILDPVIELDGKAIYRDGVFDDEYIGNTVNDTEIKRK